MARPSKFTQALADEICERIANGESLREICESDHIPNRQSVRRWLLANSNFRIQYAQAREAQADFFADQILDVANDGRNDWEVRENERTGAQTVSLNAESVMRSRLRVDTLKWLMGKMAPKKYGEKFLQEEAGVSVSITINQSTLPALQAGYKQFREVAHGRN